MIINVSKRTDIPALYGEWFIKRLKEGYVYSVNPFNHSMVKRISLSKEDVGAFVFWSKNPLPFMKYLDDLEGYVYYFQVTLTPYGKDLEEFLPNKEVLIDAFVRLSNKIGKEKVIWRYDPIILTKKYTVDWHIKTFKEYCMKLAPYTRKVIISFVDEYVKNQKVFHKLGIRELTKSEMLVLAEAFGRIAKHYGLLIETCAEKIDLSLYGINHAKCVDGELIEELGALYVNKEKHPYQRDACLCVKSVDIGSYDTCVLGCTYCYAVKRRARALKNYQTHDVGRKTLLDVDIVEQKKARTLFD